MPLLGIVLNVAPGVSVGHVPPLYGGGSGACIAPAGGSSLQVPAPPGSIIVLPPVPGAPPLTGGVPPLPGGTPPAPPIGVVPPEPTTPAEPPLIGITPQAQLPSVPSALHVCVPIVPSVQTQVCCSPAEHGPPSFSSLEPQAESRSPHKRAAPVVRAPPSIAKPPEVDRLAGHWILTRVSTAWPGATNSYVAGGENIYCI